MKRLGLILFVVLAAACQQTQATTPTGPTASGDSGATGPTAPPPPEMTKVPNVEGVKAGAAKTVIRGADLSITTKTKYTSQAQPGTILSQTPSAKAVVEVGTTIILTIAEAFPLIPDVVGMKLTAARQTLTKAGFDVSVRKQTSTQPKDTVIAQSPVGGTAARPGRAVTLIVAKSPPPDGCSNPTPGYSPCLEYHGGADYDCAGGSGDGPYYTQPGVTYRVTGFDPYGLDADNDGYGCE
jgi:hypothetical protein